MTVRYAARITVDCDDVGRRVTVRRRLPAGGFGDVVGILESCDEDRFGVRDRQGTLRRIDRREVVAARVVPPPPAGRRGARP